MATIHNIELDLFARTSTGEEINLGKVQVPITIDVNPRPTRPRQGVMPLAQPNPSRVITREDFDTLGNKK